MDLPQVPEGAVRSTATISTERCTLIQVSQRPPMEEASVTASSAIDEEIEEVTVIEQFSL